MLSTQSPLRDTPGNGNDWGKLVGDAHGPMLSTGTCHKNLARMTRFGQRPESRSSIKSLRSAEEMSDQETQRAGELVASGTPVTSVAAGRNVSLVRCAK